MATRHPLILDSEGIIKELSSSDIINLTNNSIVGANIIDSKQFRVIDNSGVVFSLPQNRGYFGQTLVTDNQGNVSWQALDSVQYTDSDLLLAFNNSLAQLHHDYLQDDSENFAVLSNLISEESNQRQSDISSLDSQLQSETSTRISNVSSLLSLIQTETVVRRNADSDLNIELLKVREKADSEWVLRQIKRLDVDSDWIIKQLYTKAQSDSDLLSKTQVTNTVYVNAGGNTFANAIAKVGTSIAYNVVLPPGSMSSATGTTTITNGNLLNITGPVAPSQAPAVEILGKVVLTGSASTRVRFSHVQFDSEFELNGTQGRHSFKGVNFEKAMRITGATTNFLIFEDCAFDGGFIVPNTFGGVIFLIRCSFNNIAPTLSQFSTQQVIITQCTGFPSFPTNATVTGTNSLTSGFVREQVNELLIGKTRVNQNIDSDWITRQVAGSQGTTFTQECDEFTATANQTTFTLSQTPDGKVALFRNGMRIRATAISVSGTTVTYNPANNDSSALNADDIIICDYIRSV